MNYGLYLPNYGKACSAQSLAELAQAAEEAGWDGLFIWDHILLSKSMKSPMVDPWVALAAVAAYTKTIKLGTTVTPIPRRRPWKLARETVTLDHLSQGRLILSVGLGEPADVEFSHFGEEPDPIIRAEKLDEGLDILTGLWKGESFNYQGKHYTLEKTTFLPSTFQKPRIPIWVGGWWPNKPPFRRAAKYDGIFPLMTDGKQWSGNTLTDIKDYIAQHRKTDSHFDYVRLGRTAKDNPEQARKKILPFANAGLTWWLENLFLLRDDYKTALNIIQKGSPKI